MKSLPAHARFGRLRLHARLPALRQDRRLRAVPRRPGRVRQVRPPPGARLQHLRRHLADQHWEEHVSETRRLHNFIN